MLRQGSGHEGRQALRSCQAAGMQRRARGPVVRLPVGLAGRPGEEEVAAAGDRHIVAAGAAVHVAEGALVVRRAADACTQVRAHAGGPSCHEIHHTGCVHAFTSHHNRPLVLCCMRARRHALPQPCSASCRVHAHAGMPCHSHTASCRVHAHRPCHCHSLLAACRVCAHVGHGRQQHPSHACKSSMMRTPHHVQGSMQGSPGKAVRADGKMRVVCPLGGAKTLSHCPPITPLTRRRATLSQGPPSSHRRTPCGFEGKGERCVHFTRRGTHYINPSSHRRTPCD
jgi:hypothetical protein